VKLLAREGTLRERIASELAQVDGAKLDTAAEHERLTTHLLELPAGAQPVSERALREALCRSVDWREQRRVWEGLKAGFAASHGPARP